MSVIVRLRLCEADLRTRDATRADVPWMYGVHRAALGPWVEKTWGWDEEVQRRKFMEAVDQDVCEIIVVEGTEAGYIRIEENEGGIFLDYVALLPGYQRRGIGTRLVRAVLALGRRVELNVLKVNPARRLYERLGFRVIGGDDFRWRMSTA